MSNNTSWTFKNAFVLRVINAEETFVKIEADNAVKDVRWTLNREPPTVGTEGSFSGYFPAIDNDYHNLVCTAYRLKATRSKISARKK